ncbi:TetR/AcrR family transcriptional regulator [Tepidicaulis sp. LMO-SS28]|uniref:TetR/AcrR family transcriptional regulator n=1 Tax=Tepidicaulis sp. LMO-SS28 TaxID=3447455 RepID=UPI003EE268AB
MSAQTKRRSQAERKAEAEQKLLASAALLFAEKGSTGTSLNEVARQADLSAGLVAHHFGSKSGLIDALVAQVAASGLEDIYRPVLERGTGYDTILGLVDAYIGALAHAKTTASNRVSTETWLKALYVTMAESLGPASDKRALFAAHNRGFVSMLEEQVDAARAKGEITAEAPPRAVAEFIVSALRGWTLLHLIDPDHYQPGTLRAEIKAAIAARLQPKTAP